MITFRDSCNLQKHNVLASLFLRKSKQDLHSFRTCETIERQHPFGIVDYLRARIFFEIVISVLNNRSI